MKEKQGEELGSLPTEMEGSGGSQSLRLCWVESTKPFFTRNPSFDQEGLGEATTASPYKGQESK
jgi:hypothetical protein